MVNLMNLGIVKTISISSDLFNKLSENEVSYLEGMLSCSSKIKWIISNDKKEHIEFIYSQYPKSERDGTTINI